MLGKWKVAPAMIGSFAFGPRGARKDAGRSPPTENVYRLS
jgi:hypothetical protein